MSSRLLYVGLLLSVSLALSACADRPENTWSLAEGGLYSGAIGPEGDLIATGSVFHGGALWHLPDFTRRYDWNLDTDRQLDSYSVFTDTRFSGNGQRVLTIQARRMVVWSVADGRALAYYETPASIRSSALDHDGRRLLVGLEDGTVAVFEVDTGDTVQRLDGHQGAVHSAMLSADGRTAVTGGDDSRAILWSVDEGRVLQHREHDNQVRSVALSASGDYAFSVAAGEDGQIWSTSTGNPVRTVPAGHRALSAARFANNDNLLVVGDRRHYVATWSLQNMERVGFWRLPGDGLYARTSNVILDVRWVEGEVYALSSSGKLALLR